MSHQYNILWVTLDSLKATALPVYGNPHVIAPNAMRVARDGATFVNALCQMPGVVSR